MPAGPARLRATTVLVALAASALASCGGTAVETPSATVQYATGLTEDLYLPAGATSAPLVVMVPGGGWRTADPAGLAGLAADLAHEGIAAAPVHLRAAEDGVVYPEPVEEVLCAAAVAVEEMRSRGVVPERVALLGHSSGAHLAALAVLAPDRYTSGCRAPAVAPDALIGLSGPYDISRVPDLAAALMEGEPAKDPAAWTSANPVEQATLRPDVPVLLLHGAADDVVPVSFTTQFATALEHAGHATTVQVVPRAGHEAIYRAGVAGHRIARWLRALPTG